jgi:hypothetical protein
MVASTIDIRAKASTPNVLVRKGRIKIGSM